MVVTMVAICGSIRESLVQMREVEQAETKRGSVVLFPVPVEADDHDSFLDALHLYRITMADRVIAVAKPDGSYGISTQREIEFAYLLGKPVARVGGNYGIVS